MSGNRTRIYIYVLAPCPIRQSNIFLFFPVDRVNFKLIHLCFAIERPFQECREFESWIFPGAWHTRQILAKNNKKFLDGHFLFKKCFKVVIYYVSFNGLWISLQNAYNISTISSFAFTFLIALRRPPGNFSF
jgi:hypothetical protein